MVGKSRVMDSPVSGIRSSVLRRVTMAFRILGAQASVLFFVCFLAARHSMQDLSSLPRD